MTREEYLKSIILKKYKSLRQFALDVGIAPSTLTTILNSGIGGTAIDTMFTICDKLDIQIALFHPNKNIQTFENTEKNNFINIHGLNEIGIEKVNSYVEDLKSIEIYTQKNSSDTICNFDSAIDITETIKTNKVNKN